MKHSPSHIGRKLTAGAVVAGIGVSSAIVAPVAIAHDSVIGGSVTEGDVLDEFPEEITLEFSGIPREGFNNFAITDQDSGEVLFSEEPEVDDRELTVAIPEGETPGDGSYLLGFQITSSDGHATRGGVSFSVEGDEALNAEAPNDPEESSEASEEQETTEGMSGPMKWILAGGGVLAIIAVLAVMLVKRRGYDAD